MHTTSTPGLPSLDELSTIAATHNPSGVAFGEGRNGRSLTWAAFDERSRRAANALRETVAQGDRVAFLCDRSLDHVTLWNGALKAGCLVSNLHTRASHETLSYCLDALRPRVVVVDEAFADAVERYRRERGTTGVDAVVTTGDSQAVYETPIESFLDGHDDEAPDVRVREDDVAAVLWTSGTTGRPKGWCHTHRTLGHRALQLEKLLALDRHARQPHVFTPSFAAWYSLVLPALYANASTYFLADWQPDAFAALVEARAATSAVLIPTMWQEVLRLDSLSDYDLTSLERVVTSGERLDATTLGGLREHVCETVYNSYAATEAVATAISTAELDDRVESVGKPMSGTQVRVVEEGGPPDAEQAPGDVGEIVIKAPDRPVWAWEDTARTEAAFEDGWWYSGDLGYRDDEGYLYLEGRTDFMIMSKGIKVFPTPIEDRLTAHPGVEQAVVVGVPDEEYGEKVTAVVRRSAPGVTADDLDEWCLGSDEVAPFERPRAYRFVDASLPRTATGKLDRGTVVDDLEERDE